MALQHPLFVCTQSLAALLIASQISACAVAPKNEAAAESAKVAPYDPTAAPAQRTVFPQIHTNLNGMVSEFVRVMYQDKKGNFWFGTNGNGIIRYDGHTLQKVTHEQKRKFVSVREIVEDQAGNIWLGTSSGLVKYDGDRFTTYSTEAGLPHEEIWGLTIDANGLIWVGTLAGVSHFDGSTFQPFALPNTKVANPQHMLSDKAVMKLMEDRHGVMWLVTDGNGIFTYHQGAFTHLTKQNGLADNSVSDVLEDRQGNIWIGTFYGGVSRFDGKTYTHFTQEGVIEGVEAYNFCEDKAGNIWFSAENTGVYRYDGKEFDRFTTEDGLATNSVQAIYEDRDGQIWLSTWQGISLYDGQHFMNAKEKAPWTN
jgi:ligand-binding sensor domain-containing protein